MPDTISEAEPSTPLWAAVWATGLGVSSLTAAEMLSFSLLTPIGEDLGITEGMAGQALTATLSSPFSLAFSSPSSRAGSIGAICCCGSR